MCPVNRLSRSINISSQSSMWYRGGYGPIQSLDMSHSYKHCVRTFPWFCAFIEMFSSEPAAPNMTVSRPDIQSCIQQILLKP